MSGSDGEYPTKSSTRQSEAEEYLGQRGVKIISCVDGTSKLYYASWFSFLCEVIALPEQATLSVFAAKCVFDNDFRGVLSAFFFTLLVLQYFHFHGA